jgi:hypothetical protein
MATIFYGDDFLWRQTFESAFNYFREFAECRNWNAARVTRSVREKIAQNVAQPFFYQNYHLNFSEVKSGPKISTTSVIFKRKLA